ncbi:hypothetical protein BDZ90DRAFT_262440 [Jaminaea rosea]|uniref:HECT-type E3 ubiquitin transferase n=1 Tax=Jaminaea rosea TaxID=1569628 RepID=A0A316UJC6_9BASI|nr:hypothetical protein BDZ90DRAFT_262440 [Jaminaea rosea]PWN25392.1 hypothetical protein BDZ90DRAFT_262440 [Jaminaea rosea]
MRSSSSQGQDISPARPSRPPAKAWSSTPPTKSAWSSPDPSSSSSTPSSGFPALSSNPSRRRDRSNPWSPAPRQSYPSRLQEIQTRALARQQAEQEDLAKLMAETGLLPSSSSGPDITTLRDLEKSAAEGLQQGEDEDFYRGPVQMYGMSRVIVRDLSEAGLKGKNRVKAREVIGGGTDFIYERHEPQRGTPKRTQQGSGRVLRAGREGQATAPSTPRYGSTTSMDLPEVIAAYHRSTRLQAVQRRENGSSSSSSQALDPLAPVIEKFQYDLSSSPMLLSAHWTLSPAAALSTWPEEVAQTCRDIIASTLVSLANEHTPPALWRLLQLCLDLRFDQGEERRGSDAWQEILRALNDAGDDAAPSHLDDDTACTLAAGLLEPLNALIKQHRVSTPSPTLTHLAHTFHLLHLGFPHLPPSIFQATSLDDPTFKPTSRYELLPGLPARTYSFLLPLSTKLRLLSQEADRIASQARRERLWSSFYRPEAQEGQGDRNAPPCLRVRRSHLLEDTLVAMGRKDSALLWQHGPHFAVHFEGEEGVDSVLGGLRREWLSLLTAALLSEGTVREAEEGQGNLVFAEEAIVEHARLLGLVVGIALLLGIGVGVRLAESVAKWLLDDVDENGALDDLATTYPTLARSLRSILAWRPDDTDTDPERTFDQTFSLNWTVTSPDGSTRPLISGGQHRPVTLANRHEYALAIAQHHLYGCIRAQLEAVQEGFAMAWPKEGREWLRNWLGAGQMASIVDGPGKAVDVELLKRTVQVLNAQRADEPLLMTWWEAVAHLAAEDSTFTCRLLAFITSSPRLPLGFLAAQGRPPAPFAIHLVDLRDGESAPLPWASTCTATLFLPRCYADVRVKVMAERLKKSVELGGEGFGLK